MKTFIELLKEEKEDKDVIDLPDNIRKLIEKFESDITSAYQKNGISIIYVLNGKEKPVLKALGSKVISHEKTSGDYEIKAK